MIYQKKKDLIVKADSFSPKDAFCKIKELFESNLTFTAIFAHSDLLAIGAMEATLQRGLKIPEDISIIGFDNTYPALILPKLTTMHVPNYEMGKMAAQILLEKINSSFIDGSFIQGEEIIYPVYGPSNYISERELKHIRAHYAGEITLVDRRACQIIQSGNRNRGC